MELPEIQALPYECRAETHWGHQTVGHLEAAELAFREGIKARRVLKSFELGRQMDSTVLLWQGHSGWVVGI